MWGRLADRVYAFLLVSFSRRHRDHYGQEMRDDFHRQRIESRARGLFSGIGFVVAAWWNVVVTGLRERREVGLGTSQETAGLTFGLLDDFRHATINLARSWTFTVVCLASLTIGVGINLAISSVLWVVLAPPPGVEVEGAREVILMTRGLTLGERWTFPDFEDVKRSDTGMELTGWATGTRSLRTDDGADNQRVTAMYVSANYFETLGLSVVRGRAFVPEEDDVVGEPPVVVSFDMWENKLGADPQIVGRSLTLNRTVHTVIGVAPQGFVGQYAGQRVDLWVPLGAHPRLGLGSQFRVDRADGWMQVLGRLQDGATAEQVNATLSTVMGGLAEAYPATNELRSARTVRYAKQGRGEEDWRVPKTLLLLVQVLSLVIVSLNIAGMVLVRGAARARELAVRTAVGSSRVRLVRYLMAESAVLAVLGAGLSLGFGWGALRAMELWIGQPFPSGLWSMLTLQAFGWSFGMMLLIGLSPAIKSSGPEILRALKDDSGGGGRSIGRIHRRATAWQTAVAIPLLVISGILLQSTRLIDEEEYGFDPDGLVVASLDLTTLGYSDEEVADFTRRLSLTVSSLPGVEQVSVADAVPLDHGTRDDRVSASDGEAGTWVRAGGVRATEGYFETIGTPLVQGRAFEAGDVVGSAAVAVVTRSLAARLWPAGDGLGQRVEANIDRQTIEGLTVVGIVDDVVGSGHGTGFESIFVSQWQHPVSRLDLVIRSSTNVDDLREAVNGIVLGLDPELTPPVVMTSEAITDAGKDDLYFISTFVGGLSALMLILVALGVYGVVGFSVTNRTREIGVRMALGASGHRVMMLILTDGLKLALPGILIGSVVAFVGSQWLLVMAYSYFGRTTLLGGVLVLAVGAVLAVVLIASSVPARRATYGRPMEALRAE